MKKILFVCERNVVMGPAAVAIFCHMGVSLLSRYEVSSGGWGTSVDINSNDMTKIQQILQKQAVPFKPRGRRIVSRDDILSSDMVLCFEQRSLTALADLVQDDKCLGHVTMMSEFYPDNKIPEIPDPLHWRDSKSYDKCYWVVYKSVRELVKKLKAEAAPPSRPVLVLPDFPNTSRCRQKRLSHPKIAPVNLIIPQTADILISSHQDLSLETVTEPEFINIIKDTVNYTKDSVVKTLNDAYNNSIINKNPVVSPACDYIKPDFYLDPPQMDLNPEVKEEPCCKVDRGGDLFDDIRKMKLSWKMIK